MSRRSLQLPIWLPKERELSRDGMRCVGTILQHFIAFNQFADPAQLPGILIDDFLGPVMSVPDTIRA